MAPMPIKTQAQQIFAIVRDTHKKRRYEKMIKKSQAKLAETKLVPGYTNIYA